MAIENLVKVASVEENGSLRNKKSLVNAFLCRPESQISSFGSAFHFFLSFVASITRFMNERKTTECVTLVIFYPKKA